MNGLELCITVSNQNLHFKGGVTRCEQPTQGRKNATQESAETFLAPNFEVDATTALVNASDLF